eukprot:gnl/TRDRNA2_/TRDRNA2_85124_c0_seq1.p1 gnl/TRDRNA2_/TRDRNA2_85124_c0~~gnl/TRDRNA2_/TRDRNA2_85124_c0_seq1.p1  ORF type:complete len:275 (+),score=25.42 gnl/TRDRNA2_/TRDRNA2_85124_c0_seq1:46-870(+)
MFGAGMGIAGCGLAASASHACAAVTYLVLLIRRNIVRWGAIFKIPSGEALKRLTLSVGALQARSMASQLATISVQKAVQGLDTTGISASAHAVSIQRWTFGCVILGGLATAATIIVPSELSRKGGGVASARGAASRLLTWGFILGSLVCLVQLASIRMLDVLTPLPEVRQTALVPSVIAAVLQLLNGLTSIGEGIMVGTQSFGVLAVAQIIATAARLLALYLFPKTLPAVWCTLAVSQSILLTSVLLHHFVTGPLASESSFVKRWLKRSNSTQD